MPATLRWAVWLLAAQGTAMTGLLLLLVYEELTAPAGSARGAVGVTVYTALITAALWLFAWSLWHLRAWARGPAIVLELLALPIGYTMLASGLIWLGLPVMIVGVVGAGALLAPTTRAALQSPRSSALR